MTNFKLGLDPGHGGKDSGAIGYSLLEKTIALNICLKIKAQLERDYEGIKVYLTRSTDVFLELDERTDMMNKLDVDALVSVHCNAGGGQGGFETFRYTKASIKSVKLQEAIHTATIAELKPFGVINRGLKTKNLHMVRESKIPAVLTENLFIDVLADSKRLKRPDVVQAIVDGHVKGVASYLGLSRKVRKNMEEIKIKVNSSKIDNGVLIDGITYVPLRSIGEAMGAKIGWDSKTKTATLDTTK